MIFIFMWNENQKCQKLSEGYSVLPKLTNKYYRWNDYMSERKRHREKYTFQWFRCCDYLDVESTIRESSLCEEIRNRNTFVSRVVEIILDWYEESCTKTGKYKGNPEKLKQGFKENGNKRTIFWKVSVDGIIWECICVCSERKLSKF